MRFVGLRWIPGNLDRARAARTLAARFGEGWTRLLEWRGLILLACGEAGVERLPEGRGFVFGERFGRRDFDALPPCDQCVDPVPGWIDERWGGYVAVLIDRGFDLIRVVRDPTGAIPCFVTELDGVHIFFSDARDFLRLEPETEVDIGFVRHFLRYPTYVGRRTGLAGVEELAPGECATYTRQTCALSQYWTPYAFATSPLRLDWEEACAALRGAAETCTEARAASHSRIALRLSGGFDSSVMLGLLRRTSMAQLFCVTEYWEGAPEGDEREQARAVARANGVHLVELNMEPFDVRYERTLGQAPTVKPTLALLSFGSEAASVCFRELGATMIASGQGGDHLFHRSRTALIAADAVRDGLGGDDLLKVAADTARLTGESVWSVFATMVRMGVLRCGEPADAPSQVLGALQGGEEAPDDHPWLIDARKATPARRLRTHQLLDALNYHDRSALSNAAPTIPILLSQPIMEVCLRTPPYVMTQGGRERSLARAAFADLVPDAVGARTAKGETTRFFAAVLTANRVWINDVLRDGRLVALGVVNRAALTAALDRDWRQDGMALDGLYTLIAAEGWLRNLDVARAAASTQSVA